jgi:hypothetical protein
MSERGFEGEDNSSILHPVYSDLCHQPEVLFICEDVISHGYYAKVPVNRITRNFESIKIYPELGQHSSWREVWNRSLYGTRFYGQCGSEIKQG